ncbi:MAG: class I SAM-dependent methyltransferase [Erysipelotrichaceae bacterium]|nr:class I SAM-dependent methyltransferase [Erysipelotrichaceae bacterium]
MISKRIKKIASLIGNEESVADIGCDHGHLAMQLRENGNRARIICSDNKIGPLNNARKNLAAYDGIEFVLGNGAENIRESVDTAVMSGLGYRTVIGIINASRSFFDSCSRMIIQINTCMDQLRRWLTANGFAIVDEHIIKDYKFYQIMDVRKGEQKLSELEIKYGPVLLNRHDDVFVSYLIDQIETKRRILKEIDTANSDYQKIIDQIKEMESLL